MLDTLLRGLKRIDEMALSRLTSDGPLLKQQEHEIASMTRSGGSDGGNERRVSIGIASNSALNKPAHTITIYI